MPVAYCIDGLQGSYVGLEKICHLATQSRVRVSFDLTDYRGDPSTTRRRNSGQAEIMVWGDGSPTCEFLYVEDTAAGIVLAVEYCDQNDPVNIGSAFETCSKQTRRISLKELTETIARSTGIAGVIAGDTSRPSGQLWRKLVVSRVREWFGFASQISFKDGLRRTIDWHIASCESTGCP